MSIVELTGLISAITFLYVVVAYKKPITGLLNKLSRSEETTDPKDLKRAINLHAQRLVDWTRADGNGGSEATSQAQLSPPSKPEASVS